MTTEKTSEFPVNFKEKIASGKKILVLGGGGLVGSRFLETFEGNFLTPKSRELDITNKTATHEFMQNEKPDVVINFSAFTKVDLAEKQKEEGEKGKCWQINVEGVRNILEGVDPEKTHLIQISTDMVFSGSAKDPGPYGEDRLPEGDPNKLTWYGFTKAEAERLIIERLGDKATIVRIIYPVSDHFAAKLDYLRSPLLKYKKEGKLNPLFNDQNVNITDVDDVAKALKVIIENNRLGIFHVASPDFSTPYKIILRFLSLVEGAEVHLEQRSVSEMGTRYHRYGGLRTAKSSQELGIFFKEIGEIQLKLVRLGVDKKLF